MNETISVNAGGGLVRNSRGEYLLILRNEMWDLPKGHQDDGEPVETTATREVMEETGLEALTIDRFLCTTQHTYVRDEKDYLKHTWWYLMSYTGDTTPTPQEEEDITEVKWVNINNIDIYLQQTYPTIIEVFKAAGLI